MKVLGANGEYKCCFQSGVALKVLTLKSGVSCFVENGGDD